MNENGISVEAGRSSIEFSERGKAENITSNLKGNEYNGYLLQLLFFEISDILIYRTYSNDFSGALRLK